MDVAESNQPASDNDWEAVKKRGAEMDRRSASAFHECEPGRRKLAIKVVDIFGNDTMTIVEVQV